MNEWAVSIEMIVSGNAFANKKYSRPISTRDIDSQLMSGPTASLTGECDPEVSYIFRPLSLKSGVKLSGTIVMQMLEHRSRQFIPKFKGRRCRGV